MKRIKPFVPIRAMQMIYNALIIIQACFDYCSPLREKCCGFSKDKLQKGQNRAARIISGANYAADVLASLGWLTLEERRIRNQSILMFRVVDNLTASNLKNSFTRICILQDDYNLRNTLNDLALLIPRREFLKKSFKYSGTKLWNSLSLEAKLAQSDMFSNEILIMLHKLRSEYMGNKWYGLLFLTFRPRLNVPEAEIKSNNTLGHMTTITQ